jgi:hypothetical protein
MKLKIKQITKALFYALSVLYPGVVFYFLVIRKIPLRQLSLFVIAFALLAFIAGTSRRSSAGRSSAESSKKKILRAFGPPFLLYGQACFSLA